MVILHFRGLRVMGHRFLAYLFVVLETQVLFDSDRRRLVWIRCERNSKRCHILFRAKVSDVFVVVGVVAGSFLVCC